jgi:hypothetical protein
MFLSVLYLTGVFPFLCDPRVLDNKTFNQYQRYSDWGNYLGLPLCSPRDSSPIKGKRKSWELNRPRELFLIKKRTVFFFVELTCELGGGEWWRGGDFRRTNLSINRRVWGGGLKGRQSDVAACACIKVSSCFALKEKKKKEVEAYDSIKLMAITSRALLLDQQFSSAYFPSLQLTY